MLLNIFYMLFKSNAKETKDGIDQLDKATKNLNEDFDKANEKANDLGKNFLRLIETSAALAGGYAGFNFFKAGAIQATEYNKQLYVTATLTKQHAGALKGLAQIAEGFSRGSGPDALNQLTSMSKYSMQTLGKPYDGLRHMESLRKQYQMVKGNLQAEQALLNIFPNEGMQMAIMASQKNWDEMKGTPGVQGAFSLTDKQAKKAYEMEQTRADLAGSMGRLNTTVADALIPAIKQLVEALSATVNKLGTTTAGAFAGVAAGIGGAALWKGLQWGAVGRILLGRKATEAGAVRVLSGGGVALAGAGAAVTGAGALAVGGATGYGIVSLFSKQVEGIMVRYLNRDLKPSVPRTVSGALAAGASGGGDDDVAFWMGKGYSHDQASGIVANMMRESSGKPDARGDGGNAHGLFQWHPGRRKAILDATGINVSTADRKQQMEAAAWEMKNGDVGFSDDYFRKLKGANSAAAYFSQRFERPADGMNEAIKRGQMALGIAAQTKSAPTSVSIGDIHINAQGGNADDIAQRIRVAIIGACTDVQSKADNGRMG